MTDVDVEAESKATVNRLLETEKVVFFCKIKDPLSIKAKAVLEKAVPQDDLCVVELSGRPDGAAIQNALAHMTGTAAIPRIYIGGKLLGGYKDVEQARESGTLPDLLRAAGVDAQQ